MLVTINTDASFHPQHKIGAFSFWMVSDKGRLFGAGELKGKIKHSTEAEFRSVLNALHFLLNKSGWSGITRIVINTDSQGVVDMVNGGKTHRWAADFKIHFNIYKRECGIEIEARKVKAHAFKDDKRKWVNSWCDKQAKKMLRKSVKSIQQ